MPKRTKRREKEKKIPGDLITSIDSTPFLSLDQALSDLADAELKSEQKALPKQKKPLARIQEIIIDEEKQHSIQVLRITRQTYKRIRNTTIGLIVFSGFYDLSSIVLSLRDMGEMSDDTITKMLGLSIDHMKYVAPASYAIPSTFLYYHGIIHGFKMAISVRYSPVQLKFHSPFMGMDMCMCCDRFRAALAVATIITIVCISAAEDGVDGDYFFTKFVSDPQMLWKTISFLLSIPFALSTFLTETPGLFNFFCSNSNELYPVLVEGELYLPPPPELPNPLTEHQQFIVNGLGNVLRLAGSVELSIEIYVVLAALFYPQSFEAQITLFSLSLLRPATSYFFYGEKGMDSVNDLFKAIKRGPSFRQLFLFVLSLVTDVFAIDCIRELYRNFLTSPSSDMPFYFADWGVEIVADSTAVFEGVVLLGATYMIYSLILDFVFCAQAQQPEPPHQRVIELQAENPSAQPDIEEDEADVVELSESANEKYSILSEKQDEAKEFKQENLLEDSFDSDTESVDVITYQPPPRRKIKEEENDSIAIAINTPSNTHRNGNGPANDVRIDQTGKPSSTPNSPRVGNHRNHLFHHAGNEQVSPPPEQKRSCILM